MRALGWRNLAPLELDAGPRFNVIHGDNGAGKSSLLEAIDYAATLTSFRGARTDDIIAEGSKDAAIAISLALGASKRTFQVKLHRDSAREVSLDGKRPRTIAQWHAAIHTVLFHPGDVELPSGGPDLRRAFLDRMLSQIDPTYAAALKAYTRAIRSRNRLLKSDKPDVRAIRAFDELLVSTGVVIGLTRARLVEDVAPLAEESFREISGENSSLGISYKPRVEPDMTLLKTALETSIDKDLARGFTAEGPHADDVSLVVHRTLAKHHASQGQNRAIVLALKVAELSVIARRSGHTPVLLLDDVSSELDRARNRRLFELLSRLGGQVFLTTTHKEFILLERDRIDFRVEGGTFQREGG